MLALHLSREFEAYILHRHAELLLVIDGKTERLHFPWIVRVRLEVEDARALAVNQKSLTINLAGIASDGKAHVLPARLREVHALKRARRPVGLMIRHSPALVLDQRELHFARLIRFADGPIAAARFALHICGAILHYKKNYARRKNHVGKSSTHSHKVSCSIKVED